MSTPRPEEEAIMRAIQAFRDGKPLEEKCVFCGGIIDVKGTPPTIAYAMCPCKRSSGYMKGI